MMCLESLRKCCVLGVFIAVRRYTAADGGGQSVGTFELFLAALFSVQQFFIHYIFAFFEFLYSSGVLPTWARNVLIKCGTSVKPTASAVSLTLKSCVFNISIARLIR